MVTELTINLNIAVLGLLYMYLDVVDVIVVVMVTELAINTNCCILMLLL